MHGNGSGSCGKCTHELGQLLPVPKHVSTTSLYSSYTYSRNCPVERPQQCETTCTASYFNEPMTKALVVRREAKPWRSTKGLPAASVCIALTCPRCTLPLRESHRPHAHTRLLGRRPSLQGDRRYPEKVGNRCHCIGSSITGAFDSSVHLVNQRGL